MQSARKTSRNGAPFVNKPGLHKSSSTASLQRWTEIGEHIGHNHANLLELGVHTMSTSATPATRTVEGLESQAEILRNERLALCNGIKKGWEAPRQDGPPTTSHIFSRVRAKAQHTSASAVIPNILKKGGRGFAEHVRRMQATGPDAERSQRRVAAVLDGIQMGEAQSAKIALTVEALMRRL